MVVVVGLGRMCIMLFDCLDVRGGLLLGVVFVLDVGYILDVIWVEGEVYFFGGVYGVGEAGVFCVLGGGCHLEM
jgi:hypothetical protein